MGCVYILENPAMPDLIKVGQTESTAQACAEELYTTGVPFQTDENNVPYQKDFQIITLYWEVWLKEMKIQSINFGTVGHPIGQKVRNLIE